MKQFSRLSVLLITVLSCIGCDQTTKVGAQSLLRGHSPISYLDGFFNLVYAENTGAMLSVGGVLPEGLRFALFVLTISVILTGFVVIVLVKPLNRLTVFAASLVIGGGFSNVIDRVVHNGSVVDFMLIKLGSLQTGIFNVADIAIIIGACMLCFPAFRSKSERT